MKKRKLPSWDAQRLNLAEQYLIIISCKKCGGAVNEGYCCTWCGTNEPR